jgi:hypothetical protein
VTKYSFGWPFEMQDLCQEPDAVMMAEDDDMHSTVSTTSTVRG